ncbi:hypothetical protein ACFROC_24965 [Nocardia tengchongensis]|uniref:hypothetical protein n=1 Tax=Nocardia tengchongensis TaxID=2055889 RepID=UPI00367A66FC
MPGELVAVTDIITVMPENTYARYATGELPERSWARGAAIAVTQFTTTSLVYTP